MSIVDENRSLSIKIDFLGLSISIEIGVNIDLYTKTRAIGRKKRFRSNSFNVR